MKVGLRSLLKPSPAKFHLYFTTPPREHAGLNCTVSGALPELMLDSKQASSDTGLTLIVICAVDLRLS